MGPATMIAPTDSQPSYDAFISYSHVDLRGATRLQRFLQGYRLPRKDASPLRPLKVYLDQTDIRAGQLARELNGALADSRALVVCCSDAARGSRWVDREIDAFLHVEGERHVAAVVLSGAPDDAIPGALKSLDLRFHDLRNAWRLGFLRPKARDELVRLVAFIAGVPLRDLIPWDKRLRRRRALSWAAVVLAVIGAVLLYPVLTWRAMDLSLEKATPGPRTILGAEVVDGRLRLLTVYQHCRDGGCVIHTSVDDVREDGSFAQIPAADYSPRHVLLYGEVVPHKLLASAQAAFPALTDRNVWISAPAPNTLVAIRPLHPPWRSPDDDTPWPAGLSQVLVRHGDRTESAEVEGLYAEWNTGTERPFSGEPPLPSTGYSIAASGKEIWIGSSEGLWQSADGGKTWTRVPDVAGVTSILLDSTRGGGLAVLVAEMAPVRSLGGPPAPREARLVERRPGTPWRAFDGPPFAAHSQLEFCGVLPDGHLVVRVDTRLYRRLRLPVFRVLLESPGEPRASGPG